MYAKPDLRVVLKWAITRSGAVIADVIRLKKMGLNYSLCAILRREHTDEVLAHLSALLDADSQARIGQLKWSPALETRRTTIIGTNEIDARGIAGLELHEYEHVNSYCFSLLVKLEPELESHLGDHKFSCFDRPDRFGCMWTSFYAGSEHLLVEMTAATTGMSSVLQQSDTIHNCWRSFAQKTNAIVAYVDLEDDCAIQLFPNCGDVILPDDDTLAYTDDYHVSVDLKARYIRHVNGV